MFLFTSLFSILHQTNAFLFHTRNAEKQFVADADEILPGTEWERIAKLCDFNPKSSKTNKDVSRMRSIILQLKQQPLPIKPKA
jgi:Clathrin light chain